MNKTDSETTLKELRDRVEKFRNDRKWGKHHSPKNLAISIAIEAAELLENFQWDDYTKSDRDQVADELADVMIYCFQLASVLDVDISTIFIKKLNRAARKYPVRVFNPKTDSPKQYRQAKNKYRVK